MQTNTFSAETLDPSNLKAIQSAVHEQVKQHALGMSEYELLSLLKGSKYSIFHNTSDTLRLFQAHFVLMHCLYSLKQQLCTAKHAHLSISALKIQLLPYEDSKSHFIDELDAVSQYYLDLNNLEQTDINDANRLIDNFWAEFVKTDTRTEALKILGLQDPVDEHVIKQHYRKLVSTHHPDRGGNKKRLQEINKAFASLRSKSSPFS